MNLPSFCAVVSAGRLTKTDDIICSIQNLRKREVETIASWLSLATGDDVHLVYIDPFERAEIKVKYVEELGELEKIRMNARQENKLVGDVA